MEIQIKITGGLLIALALIHVIFPSYFKWKTELASLSIMNRQMMYIHSLFIAITVLLMGLLCLTSATELYSTALGKRISLGLMLFWGLRMTLQIFGYSSKLWRGKIFETTVHIVFSLFWLWLVFLFYRCAFV
ncbi:MAG: hypothetical protein IPO27_02585 [Bacteroidetes bacterium]|nr:hypothetical protein [Bacteroidota bacterium]